MFHVLLIKDLFVSTKGNLLASKVNRHQQPNVQRAQFSIGQPMSTFRELLYPLWKMFRDPSAYLSEVKFRGSYYPYMGSPKQHCVHWPNVQRAPVSMGSPNPTTLAYCSGTTGCFFLNTLQSAICIISLVYPATCEGRV